MLKQALGLVAIVAAVGVTAPAASAQVPLGTAFTYQGRLSDAGSPGNGNYDLQFNLFDAASGGNNVGGPVTLSNVPVSAGLFSVAIDFGAATFAGEARWLEIGVAPGGSGGPFTPVSPRQELTPAPGAIFSSTAAIATDFSGSLAGEVTGAQTTTAVSNAVPANTPSAIVRRDASGDFAAGTISADLNGNAATATTATDFSGSLAGEVTGTQTTTAVSNAVPANTPSAIVRRDASGNFAAGTISADLNGNAASATNFSGSLSGEVTGTQTTTAVSNAVAANTANAIVRRNATGDFSAGTVSLAGNLAMANTTSSTVGVLTKGLVPFLHDAGAVTNTFVGSQAGNFGVTGGFNVGLGNLALSADSTGNSNVALGAFALSGSTTGNFNVAIGRAALLANTTGASNVAIGRNAMNTSAAGTFNVAIGAGAGAFNSAGSNNIYISHGGLPESNTIRIGDPATQTATFIAGISGATVASGVNVVVATNGHLGTIVSSRRYKQQIADLGDESDVLMRLRPVSFYYRPDLDAEHIRQFGLVAEEVAQVNPELVAYGPDGTPQTVRYHFVNALLLGEVQRQRRLIEEQQQTISRERGELEELKARLLRIEAKLAGQP